jgi:beta-mannosidase
MTFPIRSSLHMRNNSHPLSPESLPVVKLCPQEDVTSCNRRSWRLSGTGWFLGRSGTTKTYPSVVPGNVALDLIAAGELPPWQNDANFRAFRVTSEESWTYRLTFALASDDRPIGQDSQYRFVFEGIDTFAEIHLDGIPLGSTRSMFRRHFFTLPLNFDATIEHTLTVRIDPVLQAARQWADTMGVDLKAVPIAFEVYERLAARKMQMAFGWDNSPDLLTGGIHGHVHVEAIRGPAIENLAWSVESIDVEQKLARLYITVAVAHRGSPIEQLSLKIEGRSESHCFSNITAFDGLECNCRFEIHDAHLWWPNGMGEPHLYKTDVTLLLGESEVDRQRLLIGLRTIVLDTSPQEEIEVDYDIPARNEEAMDGGMLGSWARLPKPLHMVKPRHFRIRINGEPVFVRGANWQTPDIFPAAVTDEKRRSLLSAAAEANMNMVRIWGGSAAEPDSFYNEAARLGLMVWQDFFFACGKYPESDEFLAEVTTEVTDIIARLRNHTAIVIWCGDNESDMIDVNRGLNPRGNPINKRLIPDALQKGDLQARPYHPSSPSGGPYPRSDWEGDRRDWGPWYPDNNYHHIREDEARFMSEGGCYALPSLSTFEKYLQPVNRWPLDAEIVRLHTGDLDFSARRFDQINARCWAQISPPSNYQAAVMISQFAQAWAYKTLIEHHRKRRSVCGGLLLWKLNDAWPAIDSGLLDYDLQPRLAFAFVKEAMKSVALVTEQDAADAGKLNVSIVNDTQTPVQGMIVANYLLPEPGGVFEPANSQKLIPVSVPANSSLGLPTLHQPDPDGVWVLVFSGADTHHTQFAAATRSVKAAYRWWVSFPAHIWPPLIMPLDPTE